MGRSCAPPAKYAIGVLTLVRQPYDFAPIVQNTKLEPVKMVSAAKIDSFTAILALGERLIPGPSATDEKVPAFGVPRCPEPEIRRYHAGCCGTQHRSILGHNFQNLVCLTLWPCGCRPRPPTEQGPPRI